MTGRARILDACTDLAELAVQQHSVLTRRQLAGLGISGSHVQTHVAARRWQTVGPIVIVLHTGPVPAQAWRWVAVLNAGNRGALCAWSALEEWGLTGWERPGTHVVVPRGADPSALPDVVVHESRRHREDDVRIRHGLRLHSVERAALDAGAWSASPRAAAGTLAAVVQQGLSTPERLTAAADSVGRVRHLKVMRHALLDVGGGARAMSEIDVARLCRRAGLPEPSRQSRRRDAAGRWRYLDAEWLLPGARRLLLEIDGVGHLEVSRWYDDLMRAAEVVNPSEILIRIPAMAARSEPERVVALLRRHLR